MIDIRASISYRYKLWNPKRAPVLLAIMEVSHALAAASHTNLTPSIQVSAAQTKCDESAQHNMYGRILVLAQTETRQANRIETDIYERVATIPCRLWYLAT